MGRQVVNGDAEVAVLSVVDVGGGKALLPSTFVGTPVDAECVERGDSFWSKLPLTVFLPAG